MEILCKICKEQIILSFYKLFHKTGKKGTFPKLFYFASISLISKPDKQEKCKKKIISQFNYDMNAKVTKQNVKYKKHNTS